MNEMVKIETANAIPLPIEGKAQDAVHDLWRRWREIQLGHSAALARWDAASESDDPKADDPDQITKTACEDLAQIRSAIRVLPVPGVDRAGVMLLIGVHYGGGGCVADCPKEEPWEVSDMLDALAALRHHLTGQIAADAAELLDNQHKPWSSFKWLNG